jgi:hypothetical protein
VDKKLAKGPPRHRISASIAAHTSSRAARSISCYSRPRVRHVRGPLHRGSYLSAEKMTTCIASTANRRCMWFGWSSDKASFFQRAAPSLPADLVGTRDQMLALMTPRAKRTQHTCEFAFRQESLRKRPGPQRFREPTFGRLLSARCENGYRGRKLLVPAATGTLRVGLAAATPLSPSSHKPR